MTLALYGKSRRRQLILLLAAVVSVALATLGGATLRSAGQAQTEDGPDLVATKTNNVGGTVSPDGSFVWTISLSNVGNEDALVPQNNEFFVDYLPTGVSYEIVGASGGAETPSFTATEATFRLPRGTDTSRIASFECELLNPGEPSGRISCLAGVSGGVYFPTGTTLTFELEVTSLPSAPSTLTNPRSGQLCRIDPSDVVDETDESAASNDCSDTVRVEDALPDLTVTKEAFVVGSPVSEVEVGETFQWVWTVGNIGDAAAVFDQFLYPLQDDLPVMGFDALPAYGTPVLSGPHSAGATCGFTDTSGNTRNLRCQVDEGETVTIPANTPDAFIVTLDVTPGAAGTLENASQRCANLSSTFVPESDLANNDCSDTVTVVEPSDARTITIQKMVKNALGDYVADTDPTAWGFRHAPTNVGYDNATPIDNGGSFQAETSLMWEAVPAGWILKGVGWSDVGPCPSEPIVDLDVAGPAENSASVSGSGPTAPDLVYCFYNQRDYTQRLITVRKMVPNPDVSGSWMEDTQDIWGLKVGPNEAGYSDPANQTVDSGDTNAFALGTRLYAFEQVPAGWQRVGIRLILSADGTCNPVGPSNDYPGGEGSIGRVQFVDDFDGTICFYNEPVVEEREITIQKMVKNAEGIYVADTDPTAWGFRYGASDGDYVDATSINNGASAMVPVTDGVRAWELVPDGYVLDGLAVTSLEGCPDAPNIDRNTTGPAEAGYSAAAGSGDLLFCFYNEPVATEPTTNGLTVKKMVWDGTEYREYDSNLDPDFFLRYSPLLQGVATFVDHGVTNQVPFNAYDVFETVPQGWQFVGYSNEANPVDLTCPAQPLTSVPPVGAGDTPGSNIVFIDEDTSRLVCIYNQPLRNLTVKKMVRDGDTWVPDNTDWGFRYQPTSDAVNYATATSIATNAVTAVPVGNYRVWESVPEGWTLAGFTSWVTNDATCDAAGPASDLTDVTGPDTSSVTGVNLASNDVTVCFYNEPAVADFQPVTVEKTGFGTYDIDWSVTKTVAPDELFLPDDGEGDTVYTVEVDKSYTNISASGTITIDNPNPVAINVNVSDPDVTLSGACAANGDVQVPAASNGTDGQADCTWSVTLANSATAPSYSNSASITGPWGDNQVIANSGAIDFFTNDLGFVTLSDDFAGPTTGDDSFVGNGLTLTTSDSFTYTGTHTCEGINNWNTTTGIGSKTVVNIASITDTVGNNNSDFADVTVTCDRPLLTVVKSDANDIEPLVWDVAIAGQGSGTAIYRAYVPSGSAQSVTESGPSGYTLESLTCVTDIFNTVLDVDGDGGFTMPASLQGLVQDVTCTFVNIADQSLTIEKTADGLYDDIWTWTIDKDGEITAITREAGELFGVGYTTTSTPTITGRENGVVSGQVTITNTNNFAIDVSLSDSLGDIETLTCEVISGDDIDDPGNGFDVPANSVVVCDYTVADADTDATTNTVTVTSVQYPDLDGSAQATIAWLSNLNAAAPAFLEDTDNRLSSAVARAYTNETSAQVEDYARNFRCPAWPNDVYYDNGVFTGSYSFDIVNTAVLYKSNSLEGDEWDRDDHTVAVTCTVDTASVEVQKTVDWSGVPAEHQPEASFEICISNPIDPDPDAQTATVNFVNGLTNSFAPDSAPVGDDWLSCVENVAPGEYAEFDNLEPGAYVIAEKDPGTAWVQAAGTVSVYLEPGDEVVVLGVNAIVNEYQLGDLTVTKNIELAGGELPAGSQFTICVEGPSFTDGDCRTFTADEQAETWTDLIPGAYTVSETNTEPDGVSWATVITNNGGVTVPAGGEASVTVTNTLVTGDLAVTKVIEWSGFVPRPDTLDDSAAFVPFEICIQGPSFPNGDEAGARQYVTNVNGQTLQWEDLAAGTYTVIESDPGANWTVEVDPGDADSAGVVTCAPTDDQCVTPQVTITNTLAPASLTICKDFVGDETDEGVLPGITVDGQTIDSPWGEDDCFEIDVAPYTPVTVAEVLPEGYFPAQAAILSGECGIQQDEVIIADFVIAQSLSFLGLELNGDWLSVDLTGIVPGGSCEITFTNEPVGELVIVKDDRTTADEPVTWTFDVDNGELTDAAVIIGSGSDSNTVGTGAYSITEREVDGLNRVDVCQPNSPAGSYEVSVVVTQGGVVGGELAGANAEVTVSRGETTTVTFINRDCGEVLGGANLIARKFAATEPEVFGGTEGLGGWTMTLECTAGACESVAFPGELATDGAGVAAFLFVPSGEYELCEVPQGGYDVVGSLLDGSSPVEGVCRDVAVTEEAAGADGNIVVDFFNYEIPDEPTATPVFPELPTSTPTNTPVVPTNTPDVPTNTPEPTETPVDPTEEPTATPTPVDDVAGEITPGTPTEEPGAAATPIPPASGTGSGSASSGSAMFIALLGMLAILGGVTTVLAARRR